MKLIYSQIEVTDIPYLTYLESFNILLVPIEVESKQNPLSKFPFVENRGEKPPQIFLRKL